MYEYTKRIKPLQCCDRLELAIALDLYSTSVSETHHLVLSIQITRLVAQSTNDLQVTLRGCTMQSCVAKLKSLKNNNHHRKYVYRLYTKYKHDCVFKYVWL